MSDRYYETPQSRRTSLIKRAVTVAPLVRYVPKNPMFLAAVGVLGLLAWRNRQKIRDRASPMLQSAANKSSQLRGRFQGGRGTPQSTQDLVH